MFTKNASPQRSRKTYTLRICMNCVIPGRFRLDMLEGRSDYDYK